MKDVIMQEARIISAIRSARTALNWTQPDLARFAGVSLVTVARMEAGLISPRLSTVAKLRTAIEAAGVRIADDNPQGGYTLIVLEQAFEGLAEKIEIERAGERGTTA